MQPSGEYLRVHRQAETIALTSGATITSSTLIPNRAIVLGVHIRVTQAISGASSFYSGVAGDATRYGNVIGIAQDTTNIGITQYPQGYYADTPLEIGANGGDFTGGEISLIIHSLTMRGAWNF